MGRARRAGARSGLVWSRIAARKIQKVVDTSPWVVYIYTMTRRKQAMTHMEDVAMLTRELLDMDDDELRDFVETADEQHDELGSEIQRIKEQQKIIVARMELAHTVEAMRYGCNCRSTFGRCDGKHDPEAMAANKAEAQKCLGRAV